MILADELRSKDDLRMPRIVDCNVQHSWSSPDEVFEYLPQGWREYVVDHLPRAWHDHFRGVGPRPKGMIGSSPMEYDLCYRDPLGDYYPGSLAPDSVAACSDLSMLKGQHLDPARIETALLCHGPAMLIPALGAVRLTVELVQAINSWTIDRWLSRDLRLKAAILVSTQVPDAAAAEIRRAGRHERMTAVLLGGNGLGKPFGHPVNEPIFRAAAEMGLPIVIKAGGDEIVETSAYPVAGGFPRTCTEFRSLAPQSLMTHTASLICQGVMNRYPSIKFLLLGGSAAWITPFLWRFDTDFKAFRHDLLWMKTTPSEVFHEHFFVGTNPFTFEAAAGRLSQYLEVDHHLEDVICYSSGYPEREYADPSAVLKSIPSHWEDKVFRTNARRFLGNENVTESKLEVAGRV
jgi:predicted TIM-barrel fold metal-dependent hydrolase